MKKHLSILMILTLAFGQAAVFADEIPSAIADDIPAVEQPADTADEDSATDGEAIEEEILDEEQAVSEEEIEEAAAVEAVEAYLAEDEALAAEIDGTNEITKDNVKAVVTRIYKYLVQRDRYYKQVLVALKRIENTDNPVLKRLAIKAFDKEFDREVEKDKKIHQKIQLVNKFLRNHKDDMDPRERLVLNRVYRPMVIKYNEHRRMLGYIHRWIERIQDSANGDYSQNLMRAGDAFLDDDADKAKEYYNDAIETGSLDNEEKIAALKKLQLMEGKKNRVFVNNQQLKLDTDPINVNGRILVPIRAIADSLGAEVSWDAATKTATIIKGDREVTITIGKNYMIVNGDKVAIDVPAKIQSGRTMLPLRAISEALQADVEYEAETGTIMVDEDISDESITGDQGDLTDTGLMNGSPLTEQPLEDLVDDVENTSDQTVDEELQNVEE